MGHSITVTLRYVNGVEHELEINKSIGALQNEIEERMASKAEIMILTDSFSKLEVIFLDKLVGLSARDPYAL